MILFVPFKKDHVDKVNVQPDQYWQFEYTSSQEFEIFEQHESWSMFDGEKCYGMAGVVQIPNYPHRGIAWALVGSDIGRRMAPATKFIRGVLDRHVCERIEMVVDCDFEAGHRFARLLGFTCEAPRMVKYGGTGHDMALYAG